MYMYDLHFFFSIAEIFHCFSFCFCPYANSYLSIDCWLIAIVVLMYSMYSLSH